MGAHGNEDGVEVARLFFRQHVLHPVVENDLAPHVLDALNLGGQFITGHAVSRNAEMDHATGDRTRLMNLNFVTKPRQVVGGRQTAGPGTDDQDAFAAGLGVELRLPSILQGHIAKKTLHRVNTHCAVGVVSVAGVFTRVVADPPVDGRHRVVLYQGLPGRFVLPFLGQGEPGLDILTCRAGVVAGGQKIEIDGAARTQGARPLSGLGQIRTRGHELYGHIVVPLQGTL